MRLLIPKTPVSVSKLRERIGALHQSDDHALRQFLVTRRLPQSADALLALGDRLVRGAATVRDALRQLAAFPNPSDVLPEAIQSATEYDEELLAGRAT